jgi:protocatechuate 3,4-dioxygenase beta subunit
MKRTIAGVLGSLLLSAASAAAQQPGQPGQPANGNAQPAPGTATMRGHVFAADTGQALRKAQVRIFAVEIRENRMATTDANGLYEFTEVRAGRYTISASKGSYVGLSYGQQRPTDAGKPLQILDNQTVERVDFSLPRGSVVTGRIVDEFGEPMSDVQIAAQRYQFVQGQRRLIPAGRQASTDDMGEFRLFGIPPGQYYLSATWRSQNPMNNTEDRTAYAPMYFPGTENAAQAQRITLAMGQELSDLVMALKPMRATRVTGSATTSDGRPMTGMVMVMSTGGFGFTMSSAGPIRPDGTFIVNGLAPGEYTVRAQPNGMGPDAETAVAKITATGDDIKDLQLVGAKPSIVSGRIVVDPGAATSLPTPLMIAPFPVEPGATTNGVGSSPARIGDDGTFELKSSPGQMRIVMTNQPAGWTIRAVRLNGVDVIDSGIEFRANENVSGLEVELTNKLTAITGLVTNARGETVKEYSAIAFSQDREQWKGATRYQGSGRPDQDGRFKITGLPPGDYYIIALDKIDPGQSSDPDFLDVVRIKTTAVSIREGDTRTVDLKIATAS